MLEDTIAPQVSPWHLAAWRVARVLLVTVSPPLFGDRKERATDDTRDWFIIEEKQR